MGKAVIEGLNREFFLRRIVADAAGVPETIWRVWTGQLPAPPLRWKVGQRGSSVHVPADAVRELLSANQHAA